MQVLKFGGSSLANIDCFKQVAEIVTTRAKQNHIAVVLSAPQGITNDLVCLIETLNQTEQHTAQLEKLSLKLKQLIDDAIKQYLHIDKQQLSLEVENLIVTLEQLLQGARLLEHCPKTTQARILSTGEKFSVLLFNAILKSLKIDIKLLDPTLFLTTYARTIDPVANLELSKEKFIEAYASLNHNILLLPGFYGVNNHGEITTLGRNGSDYSAAALAICVEAEQLEIWTDVDGIYNADPKIVQQAQLIDSMSYQEAIELSYFGAKVLHPKTISPLQPNNITCVIKNSHSPEKKGTLISNKTTKDSVKGISNLSDVAMINVSGLGMRGMAGIAGRVFTAISWAEISVIMISQSSSEYSISFCVPNSESDSAVECLNETFALELKNNLLDPISVKRNLAVITLVGDGMQKQKGTAAKFFKALAQANVNIIAIAQDSSERSISAVIREERTDDAIKICHQNLFVKKPSIDVFIIGCGTVGGELISQIQKQQFSLAEKNILLNVVGIANSKKILLNKNGISLDNWQQKLAKADQTLSLERLNQFVSEANLSTPVFVDCTSDENIAMAYQSYLESGFHVVTANKKANTANYNYYETLRKIAEQKQRRFLYETNVGAGLPVIDNLQGLLRAGDSLIQFEGILSGSLSYIFGEIHNGLSLSQATLKAKQLGYTEPNPAEDLSGLDVARKVLVIARETGLPLELSDIQLESVVPNELAELTDAKEFMRRLPEYDKTFQSKVVKAEQNNQVLRYVAKIENNQCRVSIEAIDSEHPLYSIANGENALALNTAYYQPRPFVIRGYGAGAAVTAAGLFGDILRTLSWELEY